MLDQKNEISQEGTVKKMSDEMCRANYYAIEIWEQRQRLGLNDFSIEEIEAILANDDIAIESPEVAQLVRTNLPSNPPLFLIADNNLLYLKAHYLLLRNIGFRVETATTFERTLLEKTYDGIFIRAATEKFNTWIIARYFSITERHKPQQNQHITRIFVLLEEEEAHEKFYNFQKQGADFMLNMPLSFYDVMKVFGVRIKMNNHQL